jgi:hypothetical protein
LYRFHKTIIKGDLNRWQAAQRYPLRLYNEKPSLKGFTGPESALSIYAERRAFLGSFTNRAAAAAKLFRARRADSFGNLLIAA